MWETSGEARVWNNFVPIGLVRMRMFYSFWYFCDGILSSNHCFEIQTQPVISLQKDPLSITPHSLSLFLLSLSSWITIAQAASCCRHFVADHGAERPCCLLLPDCSFHGSYSLTRPFVSRPSLVHLLFFLTPSFTNNNKSKHTFVSAPWLTAHCQHYCSIRAGVCECAFHERDFDAGSAAAVGIGFSLCLISYNGTACLVKILLLKHNWKTLTYVVACLWTGHGSNCTDCCCYVRTERNWGLMFWVWEL